MAVHLADVDRTRHPLGQATHGRRQIADRNRQIAGQQIHRAGRQDTQRHRPTGQYARRARHGAIAARHHDRRGAAVARAGHPRRQVTGLLADEQQRQTLIGERRADGILGPGGANQRAGRRIDDDGEGAFRAVRRCPNFGQSPFLTMLHRLSRHSPDGQPIWPSGRRGNRPSRRSATGVGAGLTFVAGPIGP